MSGSRCLYCYEVLPTGETDFHPACSLKIFGKPIPPELPYTENQILELAEQVIKSQVAVTGVQPKLSLGIEKLPGEYSPDRFTIVGLWGAYILKPQTKLFRNMPELEDLTMHLAKIAKINIVEHSLIRLKSGELAYITKRVDRKDGKKNHMEDMCQLTERLTEHKYRGSYEQIGKVILNHSANPVFDSINFYEQVVFSFLTGNNDMHLKNFSLLKNNIYQYTLSPAYDLIAAELVVEGDDEELALSLNGKKKKLKRKDFEAGMMLCKIDEKAAANIFNRFEKSILAWHQFIDISFIPNDMKAKYHDMIELKANQIGLK